MLRACPGCGVERELGVGAPGVARCRCGVVWCWMCQARLRARDVPTGAAEIGLERRDVAKLSGNAEVAALAAIHNLVGRPWARFPGILADRLAGRATKKTASSPPTTCPGYLETVETAGTWADRLDANNPGSAANRAVWAGVVGGEIALRR